MALTKTEQAIADMMSDPAKRQKIYDFVKNATPDQKAKAQELFTGISNKIKQEKTQSQVDTTTQTTEQKPATVPQKVFKKKPFDQINPVVWNYMWKQVRKNTKWQSYYFDESWNAQLINTPPAKTESTNTSWGFAWSWGGWGAWMPKAEAKTWAGTVNNNIQQWWIIKNDKPMFSNDPWNLASKPEWEQKLIKNQPAYIERQQKQNPTYLKSST